MWIDADLTVLCVSMQPASAENSATPKSHVLGKKRRMKEEEKKKAVWSVDHQCRTEDEMHFR